jgi:hypothetical protein
LDRRRRPCGLPLGLHHGGASVPDDRRVLTRVRMRGAARSGYSSKVAEARCWRIRYRNQASCGVSPWCLTSLHSMPSSLSCFP